MSLIHTSIGQVGIQRTNNFLDDAVICCSGQAPDVVACCRILIYAAREHPRTAISVGELGVQRGRCGTLVYGTSKPPTSNIMGMNVLSFELM